MDSAIEFSNSDMTALCWKARIVFARYLVPGRWLLLPWLHGKPSEFTIDYFNLPQWSTFRKNRARLFPSFLLHSVNIKVSAPPLTLSVCEPFFLCHFIDFLRFIGPVTKQMWQRTQHIPAIQLELTLASPTAKRLLRFISLHFSTATAAAATWHVFFVMNSICTNLNRCFTVFPLLHIC